MNLSPPVQALLLAMIIASAGFFLIPFARALLRILRAKPSRGVLLPGVPLRCWNVFWEGLCQAKVIRGRPWPGLAHAFLLWGFCAFPFAEIDHFAQGFDLAFLSLSTTAGRLYFWFVFLFALGCAISVAGLAVRRYLVRSEWLDPGSYQTGSVLLLIFLVMTTLLPSWWIDEASLAGRVLWWVHTVAFLTLLPLIPRSKNLHILFSPVALFFKQQRFAQIPAPVGPLDPGIRSGKNITRRVALQAYSCVECGRCTESCPAYATGKELDPRLIPLGLNFYLDEHGPKNEAPILKVAVSSPMLFQCTTCGACDASCPVGIELLPMIVGLRRAALNGEIWQDKEAQHLFANLKEYGNAIGANQTDRDRFISWRQLPAFDGSQEYCLWLGCIGAFDPRGQEIVEAFASVMEYLGTSFGVLRKEYCSGDPARRLGNEELFGLLSAANLETLRRARVKKIVSICPHCVRTMAEDWNYENAIPGESDATVEHHSEFLARYAHLLPGTESKQRVVFHDPCYLGRYRGIYDEPRQVIARSGQIEDPPRAREKSFCCGAGGGLVFLGSESGRLMSETRLDELTASGADVVASACPFCLGNFREVLADSLDKSPRLLDIAQIVAEQLPPH